MIISSEITGKTYESVEECLADEKDFKAKEEAKKQAEKEHQEALDKAYEEAIAACDRYLELAGIKVEEKEISKTSDIEKLLSDFFRFL